jgi:hypothetical protein
MTGKQAFKTLRKVGITLLIALPISIYISRCSVETKPMPDDKNAIWTCKEKIWESLNDPDSAKFDYENSYAVSTDKPDIWAVRIVLSGKNAFNATIRAAYICTARKENGQMYVMGLAQI